MSEELNKLISTLSEKSFKDFVKKYISLKYNTTNVRIIDGPYDGGNDLEILKDEKEIRKNIQITVQKNGYENKLTSDIKKASDNVKYYNYLNNLDFYINQNIGKSKRNELERDSELDYLINLKIYDSNILSQEIEQYQSLIEFVYSLHDIKILASKNVTDRQTKIIYDVLSHNKNTVEIKKNFINSYIYSFLFSNPNSSVEEIFAFTNPLLNNSLDKDFLDKELNFLRMKKNLISEMNKKKFKLSTEKQEEISLLYTNVNTQESLFYLSIEKYITKNSIKATADELVDFLYKIYQENYTIDIEEIKHTNNSFSASIKKSLNDLNSFFNKKNIPLEKAKELSNELLDLCAEIIF